MDNGSQSSEPGSNKREAGLKVHQASCLLHLRGSGVLKWGHRKRVSYVSRKLNEVKSKKAVRVASESHESKVEGEGSLKQGMGESEAEEIRSLSLVTSLTGAKKKRGDTSGDSERRLSKKIAGRWSVPRCESAKVALLEVVKGMEASRQNPVLRCDLRAKARRNIGDTGLLDHLLRHMAGQVFPDGKERLVRRHNSEGAIQYWLEPAELADVRQEAGVSDPYWIPPPGWKLGDAILDHTCDGQCNEQINSLKIEIAELKAAWSQVTELKETVRNQQEEICLLKKEIEKRREDKLEVMVKETCIASRDNLALERVMAKQMVAGEEAGAMEKTARDASAFRICRPEGTFLWPDMANAGATHFFPYDRVPSATSPPLQPIALPSPTSPLPPRLPAFFCQQQPDNNRQVHSSSQVQSKGVLVSSPGQGMIQRPTIRYVSLPHDMMSSGANASNGVECGELTSVMGMAPTMNSGSKTDNVVTDLTLGSYNY